MDRLDELRALVAVADAQSFSGAARRLGISPPGVTRAVAALEARLGTQLVHRTTRIVRITEPGARFVADCRRVLGELEEAEGAVRGTQTELRGPLAITASQVFGRRHVAPVVLDFLAAHPQVTGRLLLLDRVVDVVEEGIDVAIRIAVLPDSSATAIRVGEIRRVVCASPRYLAAHGTPRRPADIAAHQLIGFSNTTTAEPWRFAGRGRTATVRATPRLSVNTSDVAIAAAVEGRGLTRVLSYMVADEVKTKQLAIVLQRFEPPPLPVHVVVTEGRRAPARVRAFVELAVDRLRAALR
jgi:DNA-binding transcriptional LysR family regulator